MKIERFTGPPVDTHSYLVYDEPSKEAWAVDAPLDTAAALLARARDLGVRVSRLVLTHGHFDHVLDAPRYREVGISVAACPAERPLLEAPQTDIFGLPYPMPEIAIDEPLREGARLRLGEQEWEVWEVPGHSPGHVALHCPSVEVVLGGDLLFAGGYGRVDLPMADPGEMAASLRRLLALPAETRIYPGHGPDTTIGAERGWLAPLLGT